MRLTPARVAIAVLGCIAAIVGALWMRLPETRTVIGPDGRALKVVWPRAAPGDAVTQFEIGRAIAWNYIYEDDASRSFAYPWWSDPLPPVDARFLDPTRLTDRATHDDFPAVASGPDATWMAWLAYDGHRDQVRLARWMPGPDVWATWNPVPGATGVLWRPELAVTPDGVWVFWSAQIDAGFDLLARRFDGARWGPRLLLGTSRGGDLDPRAAVGADGTVHLVWQAFEGPTSDILYRSLREGRWSDARVISDTDANDWEPAVAVDGAGRAVVVWDTYAHNHYDVVMRTVSPTGALDPVVPVAETPHLECRASVAVDGEGRIWVAWARGPVAWGKDQGHLLPTQGAPRGARLYDERVVEVRVLEGGQWLLPGLSLTSVAQGEVDNFLVGDAGLVFGDPELIADGAGHVHLVYRQLHSPGGYGERWGAYLTSMTASGWSEPVAIPYADGRLSMAPRLAPHGSDQLWVVWPRDRYPGASTWVDLPEETLWEDVYASRFRVAGAPPAALGAPAPTAEVDRWPHALEMENVRRMRSHTADVRGTTLRIARGDLHRHTEFSPDKRGAPDGSFLDMYRYMLDAAHLDFGAQTDHQGGGDRLYWWWLSRKAADLYRAPGGYVGLYGYERSAPHPHGHRNVIHDDPDHRPVPFYQPSSVEDGGLISAWYRAHGSGDALVDDSLYLFEEVRSVGGITISHTSATSMGTDWSQWDEEVDVVVELFQGYRHSYEQAGAPLTDPREEAGFTQRDAGYVRSAWDRGHWLGVIASSDHDSTHIAMANVWVPTLDRDAILDGLKARRTYASTTEIALDVRMGEHFMGERFGVDELPALAVRVTGTAPLAEVVVLRDGAEVHRWSPGAPDLDGRWVDPAPLEGTHYYYVRVMQADGHAAWSSPLWPTLSTEG